MTAYLIYTRYYDFDNMCLTVGGVQTYIQGLTYVFKTLNLDTCIYQTGTSEKRVRLQDGAEVIQVDTCEDKNMPAKIGRIVAEIMKKYDDRTDMLIFMANEITCPNNVKCSIAIQHGVSWDQLSSRERPHWRNKVSFYMKAIRSYKIIERLKDVKHIVCVDHNLPNWLRATTIHFNTPMTVIPNFTRVASEFHKPENQINIIYARRFFPYRGTRLFAEAISMVLNQTDNVYVTLAGNGPDEEYLKNHLQKYDDRVLFTQYRTEESLEVHADKHIAVVPTMGSEGTSLSLLEAMSAQCAVVTTDVGGLSNIVIDGYNALYAEADAEDVAEKIMVLINDKAKREEISRNAYHCVKDGFSFDIWAEKWRQLIQKMMGERK